MLIPISQFPDTPDVPGDISYQYEGRCPVSGKLLQLPRTQQVEAIAHQLFSRLQLELPPPSGGKMFGVLLVQTRRGELGVLRAFSGLLHGETDVAGWVPMIPGRRVVQWEETRTLAQLEQMKRDLIALGQCPARDELRQLEQQLEQKRAHLRRQHRANKINRDQLRRFYRETLTGKALDQALASLSWQSQADRRDRQQLTAEFNQQTAPLREAINRADQKILQIKKRRKAMSRALQTYMQTVYSLTNFAGLEMSLRDLLPDMGIPTGTGECCAPKLLHFAATHHLQPLALAEFWYGPPTPDGTRQPGHFYGACAERCQPIMGFLLSGMAEAELPANIEPTLAFVYEDAALIVVDKPSGLLSVPGRYLDRQDSVVSRVRHLHPKLEKPLAVHRLDQETSGLLLLAKTPEIHRALSIQFQQRQVHKQYQALLYGRVARQSGHIQLPLAGSEYASPRQIVDYARGKPSETFYDVLEQDDITARVHFTPITGRTHQLRVHAAHPDGLNAPIRGDRYYGHPNDRSEHLCLHACQLAFTHPRTGQYLHLVSEVPF